MSKKKMYVLVSSLMIAISTLAGCGSDELSRSKAEKVIKKIYPQPIIVGKSRNLYVNTNSLSGSEMECLQEKGYLNMNGGDRTRTFFTPTKKMSPYYSELLGKGKAKHFVQIHAGQLEFGEVTGIATYLGALSGQNTDVKKVEYTVTRSLNDVGECLDISVEAESESYAVIQKYDDGWRLVIVDDKKFDIVEKRLRDVMEALKNMQSTGTPEENLFAKNCSSCHGTDGAGKVGVPNLRDGDWLWGGDLAQVKQTITWGRSAAMPAWSRVLGDDGVKNVTAYVMSLSGRKTAGDLDAGKVKFQQLCVACHGAEAKGNIALGAPNLTDETWLYGGDQETVKTSISEGRNGRCPQEYGKLSNEEVDLLANYVQGLSKTK